MAARPVAQHAFLADALDSLQHSVERLNHAHPNGTAYDSTPTTALFLPLISAPDAPRWQDVQASLMARFGLTKQSRVAGVDPGMLGTVLVVSLLKKTVISDDSLSGLACRAWIADLDAAVTYAEAECLRRGAALRPQHAVPVQPAQVAKPSFFGSAPPPAAAPIAPATFAPAVPQQPTPPIYVPPTPASTAPAKEPSSSSQPFPPPPASQPAPSSSQHQTPAPLPPSLAALASQRRESGASDAFEHEEQDQKPFVPELHGAAQQQQGQQGDEEKDELEEPPEDEEAWDEQSSSMSHRASPSTASTPQQTQLGAALAALTQPSPYSALGFAPPAPAPAPVQAPTQTQVAKRGGAGTGAPKPKRQRHAQFSGDETPPIELARAIFGYIQPFPDIEPLPLPPTWRSLNYSFKRRHLKGQLVWAINKGFREDIFVYRPSENYLALDPKNNWCGTKAHFDAPGHPIAFIGRKDKCDEAFKAISRGVHPDKQRDGIHVFISVPIHRWLARGFYVVAYDGSTDEAALKLPSGPGALDRLHPEMRRIFVAHTTAKDAEQNKKTLHDWNFAADTYDEAVRELENGQGGQVMRFLLLKCIDFDQAAFDVWDAARRDPVQTGGRGPSAANAAAAQAAANGQQSPVQGPGPMAFV